jgi:hypothetical protein
MQSVIEVRLLGADAAGVSTLRADAHAHGVGKRPPTFFCGPDA